MTQEKIYNKHGKKLVDLVEEMEKDGLKPEMAMALILDKAIDLTFFISDDEQEARNSIAYMTNEKAQQYRNHCEPKNN